MNNNKKTAAIVSLYGNSNFGNKLQNYAVQEILKKEGLNTVNIVNVPCLNNNKVNHTEVIKLYIKGWFRYILKGDKIKDCVDPKDPKERKKNFLEFNKKIANSKHFFLSQDCKNLINMITILSVQIRYGIRFMVD